MEPRCTARLETDEAVPALPKFLKRGAARLRAVGLEESEYIVVDEEVCHGKPVFRGTRILVSDVLELLAAGVTVEEIVRDCYPDLSEEAVRAALKWAAARGDLYVTERAEVPA